MDQGLDAVGGKLIEAVGDERRDSGFQSRGNPFDRAPADRNAGGFAPRKAGPGGPKVGGFGKPQRPRTGGFGR